MKHVLVRIGRLDRLRGNYSYNMDSNLTCNIIAWQYFYNLGPYPKPIPISIVFHRTWADQSLSVKFFSLEAHAIAQPGAKLRSLAKQRRSLTRELRGRLTLGKRLYAWCLFFKHHHFPAGWKWLQHQNLQQKCLKVTHWGPQFHIHWKPMSYR